MVCRSCLDTVILSDNVAMLNRGVTATFSRGVSSRDRAFTTRDRFCNIDVGPALAPTLFLSNNDWACVSRLSAGATPQPLICTSDVRTNIDLRERERINNRCMI